MKLSTLMVLGMSLVTAGCGKAHRGGGMADDAERIRAAVFEYVLARNVSAGSSERDFVYCLQFERVPSVSFTGWEYGGPRWVVPAEKCEFDAGAVTYVSRSGARAEKEREVRGSLLSVRDFEWKTRDEVQVRLTAYCGAMCGGWSDVQLLRTSHGWEVQSLEDGGRY